MSKMMKCVEVVGIEPTPLVYNPNYPRPSIPAEGAIVKVSYCGMCRSDVHVWRKSSKLPVILGHESSGVIEAIGDKADNHDGLSIGDKVVIHACLECGNCKACKQGNTEYCEVEEHILGITQNGCYAEYVSVSNLMHLVPVPDSIPMEVAATLACGTLTAYHAVQSACKEIGDILQNKDNCGILIIGAGGLGLSAVILAKQLILSKHDHIQLLCADTNECKLSLAMDAGCHDTIHWSKDETTEEHILKTKSAFPDGGPLVVMDFVGSTGTFDVAYKSLRKHGHILCAGLQGGDVEMSFQLTVRRSVTVKGIFLGTVTQLKELVQIYAAGKISPLPYTVHKLEEAPDLICKLRDNQTTTGRAVLSPLL